MFKQEYQAANDRIHAGDALLARIRAGQRENRVAARRAWWAAGGAVAAAAVVLIAILAFPQGKSASPAADAAAPMPAEGDRVKWSVAANEDAGYAEEPAMEMAVAEEEAPAPAPSTTGMPAAECADAAPTSGAGIIWLYDGADAPFAMDDWFVRIRDEKTLMAAREEDGRWSNARTFALSRAAHSLILDDDRVLIPSVHQDGTAVALYELTAASELREQAVFTQAGTYVDALAEDGVLYLLTETDAGLCLSAVCLSDPDDWRIEQQLGVYGGACLFEADDGVLLAVHTGGDSELHLMLNEPDGFAADAWNVVTGTLMYAYLTEQGMWHAIFAVDGMLVERMLDETCAVIAERAMELEANMLFLDEDELLVCTYPDGDDTLLVSHYTAVHDGWYAHTGETWRTETFIGEIVSWDDDDGVLYALTESRLYAFDVRAGTVEAVLTFPDA